MYQINEHSVTSQHLILLLMFLKYKTVKKSANRNGKFGDMPTGHLSGGVKPTASHCRNGPAHIFVIITLGAFQSLGTLGV